MGDAADPALPDSSSFDVVLSRHVLGAARPGRGLARHDRSAGAGLGPLLLVEAAAGVHRRRSAAAEVEAMIRAAGRRAAVRHLPESVYWGKAITDERYLVVSSG